MKFMANINDLMLRYKTQTAGAIRKFITRHLDKINADGIEHAKQTSEGWYFDAEAVRIIDELRGVSQVAVIEQIESERVKELQEENENLRQLLLIAQSKLIQTQEELQKNQQKLLVAEKQTKENDMALVRAQADLEIEKTQREVTEGKFTEIRNLLEESNRRKNELDAQLAESKNQLEKIKNRGLLDRLFNHF